MREKYTDIKLRSYFTTVTQQTIKRILRENVITRIDYELDKDDNKRVLFTFWADDVITNMAKADLGLMATTFIDENLNIPTNERI